MRMSIGSWSQDGADTTDAADVPQTPRTAAAASAAERFRSSVRYFGSLVINPGSASADYLSTGGNLILMRSSISTISLTDEKDDSRCCTERRYHVPQSILKKGFVKLESRYTSSSNTPGELPPGIILGTLRRFDTAFRVARTEVDRLNISESLDTTERDIGKVKWNDPKLLEAFSVKMNACERLYFTVDVNGTSSSVSRVVSGVMVSAIVASIAIWMAGTMSPFSVVPCPGCEPEPLRWMQIVDEVCVMIFTAEFLVRMLTAPFARTKLLNRRFLLETIFTVSSKAEDVAESEPTVREPSAGRFPGFPCLSNWWSFWKQPSAVVDLFTVLPYWIEVIFATSADSNFIWLRLFRLLRVSRIFKLVQLLNSDLGQLSDAQHLLANVFVQAFPACAITNALLLFALIVFSALMYTVERGDWYPESVVLKMDLGLLSPVLNPDAVLHEARTSGGVFMRTLRDGYVDVSPYTSILESCWWTLATITTVGYGDNTPVTEGGKFVGSLAILYGTILLGLPIGIIGSQFSTEFARMVQTSRSRQERNKRKKNEAAEVGRPRSRGGLMGVEDQGGPSEPVSDVSPSGSPSKLRHKVSESVVNTFRMVMNAKKKPQASVRLSETSVSSAAARLYKLPLRPRQREQLISAKYNFEDLLKMHGESLGISAETQQAWIDSLWAVQFCAGPELDRLSARILTYLSDAEMRRGGGCAQQVRLAWFDLCMACCSVSEKAAQQANAKNARSSGSAKSDTSADDRSPCNSDDPEIIERAFQNLRRGAQEPPDELSSPTKSRL